MRQQLWLGGSRADDIIAQCVGGAAMQHLTPALEQILISGILDERVLKTVVGLRRNALHQQDVGLGEPFERRLQGSVLHAGHGAQERVGETASDHSADLRHLAGWTEAIEPGR
jgi:hypothetical protein